MKPTRLLAHFVWVAALLLAAASWAQTPGGTSTAPVARPAIVGVAHIGLKTDNLEAARKFYTGILGFEEPFSLDMPPGHGSGLLLTTINTSKCFPT